MTEDIGDFDGIVSASYSMDERQLFINAGRIAFRVLPNAKHWILNNLPDRYFDVDCPLEERYDALGFGILAFIEQTLVVINPSLLLTGLTRSEQLR